MHNFFDALAPEIRAEIEAVSSFRNVLQGDMIVRAGDASGQLYQLYEGRAKLCTCDAQGRETVSGLMKDGDWIGISEMFTALPAMSDVVALAPVRLRIIQQRDFESLLDRHPAISRQLLRVLSLRFSLMYYLDIDRNVLTLKERVLKTLYMLSFSHGKRVDAQPDIVIEMSQEELSKLLVASRQNLNRTLKELEREGMLTVRYGAIHLRGLEQIQQQYGYLVNVAQPAASYID